MSVTMPGFDTPAVGFEQPFELLQACHERVQRSLALLGRLIEHIDAKGHDEQSRSAAADVLRYFDHAAPLHHEDEELHVFPPLLERGEAPAIAAVKRLQRDHEEMAALWARLRVPLSRWAQGVDQAAVEPATRQRAAEFSAIYPAHIEAEESLVYPLARALVDAHSRACMGAEMQARRS